MHFGVVGWFHRTYVRYRDRRSAGPDPGGCAALAAEDRSGWSAAAQTDRLLEIRAVKEQADAELIRAVGDWDAAGAWAQETALGPVSWLAWKGAMPRSAAHKLLRTARLARQHERTGAALAAGEITVPHVEALAAVAHRRAELYAEHEETLVEAARTVEVVDFARATRRWAALADDELARTDAAFAFERRGITLSPTTGGSVVSGFLDPEASCHRLGRARGVTAAGRRATTRARSRSATPTGSCCSASDHAVAICPNHGRSRGRGRDRPRDPGRSRRPASSTRSAARSRASVRSPGSPPSGWCATARSLGSW